MKNKTFKPETLALYKYDPLTGIITRYGKALGSINPRGHRIISTPEGPISAQRLIMLMENVDLQGMVVHHKNEIKDDQKRANLEVMTSSDHIEHHNQLRLSKLPEGSDEWQHLKNYMDNAESFARARATIKEEQKNLRRFRLDHRAHVERYSIHLTEQHSLDNPYPVWSEEWKECVRQHWQKL